MSTFSDVICCNEVATFYKVDRCDDGDIITNTYTADCFVKRDLGVTLSSNNQNNTATTKLYIDGDTSWLCEVKNDATGMYVAINVCNSNEYYRVERFIEYKDIDCCTIDHFELELTKVKKPKVCP